MDLSTDMKDKVGATDKISIILNGKPVEQTPQLVCPKCGVDRSKETCPLGGNVMRVLNECPMVGKAQ